MICRKCHKEVIDGAYCLLCGAKQEVQSAKKRCGNGQGSVYKRGNTWTAKIEKHVDGSRYVKTKGGFTKRKDALDWLTNATFTAPKSDITFKALYDEWSGIHYPTIGKIGMMILMKKSLLHLTWE